MPVLHINDIDQHYQDVGEGEVLLLLHGLGSCPEDWEHQIPVFARHFRVIVPSLRGFGQSTRDALPHSVETWASDMLALLDHLGVERAHLLGFSMGGAIAFQLGVDRPERFASLLILNSQPSFELSNWTKHMMVLVRIGMAHIMGMQRLARYVAKRLFPRPEQADLRRKMIERHGGNDRRSYLSAVDALAGWTVEDRLDALTMPVLMIAAELDYSPLEEKREYVEKMRDARLVVLKGSHHASHIDATDEFNRIALEFLLAQRQEDAARPERREAALK